MGAERLGTTKSGIGAGASRRWLSREGLGVRGGCRNNFPICLPSPGPLPKGEGTVEEVISAPVATRYVSLKQSQRIGPPSFFKA